MHADNSAAIGLHAPNGFAAVRPGIFLYGVGVRDDDAPLPVVTMRARVVDLRWVEPGDSVSYDATYIASRREQIATVAIGYGDGYPRSLSGVGSVLINGSRASVRGRVTMDMTMIDVTSIPCRVGDVATLITGSDEHEHSVARVAAAAAMSPYELLTGLAPRLERRYHHSRG